MNKLYKLFLLTALITLPNLLNAQGLCPYIGPDLFLPCGQNSTTLTADFSNCPPGGPGPLATTSYMLNNIPFAPAAVAGTNINLTDDSQTGPFPIGFSFCFFGNSYTQFWVGSNGWISFSAGQSTSWGCSTVPIPSTNPCVPKNCIMGPYADWNPGAGGSIKYQTTGVAPCRKLVVSWTNMPMFSCGVAGTFQIILYESTNIIENHITLKNNCFSWNSNSAVQGIQNLAGTVASVVPGRNGAGWSTNNNSYRWTPSGAPVPVVYTWYQVGNPVPVGTGLTLNINPVPGGGASYTCHPEYGACYNGYMTCMGFGGANGPDTILVVPGPPNLNPSIPGPYDFCPGTSITVGADQLYTTYLWSDGSTGPNLTTNIAGPISVNVTDINGCTGSANALLNMWPNPILNVVPVNPAICPNGTVQMTASGAASYVWSPANSLDNPNSNVVNATPTGTTLYSIVGTDINGCVDSVFNSVTVLTPPTVIATADVPGVCPTYTTNIHAVGALNYVWIPVATIATPNAANSLVAPVATTIYQVIGTDINGCSDTDAVTVLVYDVPNINFTAPVVDGCSPVTVNFQNNSTIANGTISTYIWNVEGQGFSNLVNPSFTFSNSGPFDVVLVGISDHGCIDSMSAPDFVNVYSIPTADFYASPQPAELGNALIYFTNTSTADAVNFLWNFDGLGTSTGASPSYTFSYADTFYVTLWVSTIHGCIDTISHPVIIDEVTNLYIPNSFTPGNMDGLNDTWFPVGRKLNTATITIDVEVFDRWGMSVFKSNSSDKPWNGKVQNMTSDCPQDVYTYKIYFKNQLGDVKNYTGNVNLIR